MNIHICTIEPFVRLFRLGKNVFPCSQNKPLVFACGCRIHEPQQQGVFILAELVLESRLAQEIIIIYNYARIWGVCLCCLGNVSINAQRRKAIRDIVNEKHFCEGSFADTWNARYDANVVCLQ